MATTALSESTRKEVLTRLDRAAAELRALRMKVEKELGEQNADPEGNDG